jgi:hypothetical protein
MEWIGIAFFSIVAFLIGRNSRQPKTKENTALSPSGLNAASDRDIMLATFRREIANFLVRLDPDRFVRLYRKARSAEAEIEGVDEEVRDAQSTLITKRYPMYENFDLIGTRPYVLYADALSSNPIEDIEEHFLNLVKFHALQRAGDEDWQFRGPVTSDKEFEHLQSYVRQIKDTRFRQRLVSAVNEFYAQWRRKDFAYPEEPGEPLHETATFSVFKVPHFAESRYGFHFKDSDEYGLYGCFLADGRDKPYESHYRSDWKFEAEIYLDCLQIDEVI